MGTKNATSCFFGAHGEMSKNGLKYILNETYFHHFFNGLIVGDVLKSQLLCTTPLVNDAMFSSK